MHRHLKMYLQKRCFDLEAKEEKINPSKEIQIPVPKVKQNNNKHHQQQQQQQQQNIQIPPGRITDTQLKLLKIFFLLIKSFKIGEIFYRQNIPDNLKCPRLHVFVIV